MVGTEHESVQVTVITPAYNAATHIAETIASVRRQTFSNFRYVIIDDGSTDETVAVARQAAAGDPRIQIQTIAHAGMYSARNRALEQADTEFISFVDADDVWQPAFLETLVAALVAAGPNVGGVFCRSRMIDAAGRPFRRLGSAGWAPPGRYDLARMLETVCPPGNCSCLVVRRCCFEDVGRFDDGLKCVADFDLWLRICRNSSTPYFEAIAQPLVSYRQHGRNFSALNRRQVEIEFRLLFGHYVDDLERAAQGRAALGFAAYAMRNSDRAEVRHWLALARQAAWRDHFRSPEGVVALLGRVFGVTAVNLLLNLGKRLYREI
jgi:glycosyltransferase involved in cell wall biosynthesis